MHVKLEPLIIILLFEIRIYVKFYYFFISHGFQGSRKIELKTQLQVSKKKTAWIFEDMKTPLCTNSSFINSIQINRAHVWFKILTMSFSFVTIFMCKFWVFLLKTVVSAYNFWTVIRKSKWLPFLESAVHFLSFIWHPTWLYLDKIRLHYI